MFDVRCCSRKTRTNPHWPPYNGLTQPFSAGRFRTHSHFALRRSFSSSFARLLGKQFHKDRAAYANSVVSRSQPASSAVDFENHNVVGILVSCQKPLAAGIDREMTRG